MILNLVENFKLPPRERDPPGKVIGDLGLPDAKRRPSPETLRLHDVKRSIELSSYVSLVHFKPQISNTPPFEKYFPF